MFRFFNFVSLREVFIGIDFKADFDEESSEYIGLPEGVLALSVDHIYWACPITVKRFFHVEQELEAFIGVNFVADYDSESGLVSGLPGNIVELPLDHKFFRGEGCIKRFFDTVNKLELVRGVHFECDYDIPSDSVSGLPEGVIELPLDHDFFKPLEAGNILEFDGDGVPGVVIAPEVVLTFAEVCAAKKISINAMYVDAIELFLADYPPAERDTFPEQALESIEYKRREDASEAIDDDNFPMLKHIAARKGISVSLHKNTVLSKRNAFNVICGQLTGEKYALFTQLEAIDPEAEDALDQVEAVDEFSIMLIIGSL